MREDISEGCGLIGEYDCFKGIELEPKVKDLIEIFIEAWQECKSTPHCAECKYWHKRERGSLLACLSERYAEKVIAAGYCKDAAPVVHAHWDDSFDGITPYCSACGMSHGCLRRTPDYCPNCGAKMDEKAEPLKDFEGIGQPSKVIG